MRLTPNNTDALAAAGSRTEPTMSLWEKRNVFREMVATTCGSGKLTPWRRRQLVQYAASLGLHPVQAGRLVEEARANAATARSIPPTVSLSYVLPCTSRVHRGRDIAAVTVLVTILLNAWFLLAILL